MRKAKVYMYNELAGFLTESEEGYSFVYDNAYLTGALARPVSLTLPLQDKPYVSRTMLPFFDGLIPEGWLLEIAEKNWKLNARDRMGLLLACCRDCIGAVSIEEDNS
ncbi:MAG: phosphatidylinositol kinase [Bacteroidales bacterium]|jgi:serine/threonine-protein kinase HipA|nr:phosphatidylinositol kinase [Bacteroidales bacterium]